MSCCSSNYIGCFDSCNIIELGANYLEDGEHRLRVRWGNVISYIPLTGVIGEPITIDLSNVAFNESGLMEVNLIQPSGEVYNFDSIFETEVEVQCISFKINVVINV